MFQKYVFEESPSVFLFTKIILKTLKKNSVYFMTYYEHNFSKFDKLE